MVRQLSVVVVVGLLGPIVGCRQPNPEWQGPATDGAATVVDPSGVDTTAAGVTGGGGPLCQSDADCDEPTPICSRGSCLAGEGGPCAANTDCADIAPFCNPDGACQVGSEGEPCAGMGQPDCSNDAPYCVGGFCMDGSPGDPCTGNGQCMSNSCVADVCE